MLSEGDGLQHGLEHCVLLELYPPAFLLDLRVVLAFVVVMTRYGVKQHHNQGASCLLAARVGAGHEPGGQVVSPVGLLDWPLGPGPLGPVPGLRGENGRQAHVLRQGKQE